MRAEGPALWSERHEGFVRSFCPDHLQHLATYGQKQQTVHSLVITTPKPPLQCRSLAACFGLAALHNPGLAHSRSCAKLRSEGSRSVTWGLSVAQTLAAPLTTSPPGPPQGRESRLPVTRTHFLISAPVLRFGIHYSAGVFHYFGVEFNILPVSYRHVYCQLACQKLP